MRIELPYTARIRGLISSRSRAEATKTVLRRGEFDIAEFSGSEAPVAYRRYADHGRRNDPVGETRWLNGRHWRIVEPSGGIFDHKSISLDGGESYGLYGPVFPDRRTDLDWAVAPSAVEGWHRVTDDTTDVDHSRFKDYVERDTALIGGKFAFCVDEPQVGVFVHPDQKSNERSMAVSFSSGVTTTGLEKSYYQMPLKEFPEALEEIRRVSPVQIARYRGTFERSDIIIPEAFTDSMVESAAARTVELTLTIGHRHLQDFELPSRVAFKVAFDKAMRDGKLISDALEVPQILAEFGDLMRRPANRRSKKEGIYQMRHCMDVLLPIATGRLAERRSLTANALIEPTVTFSPFQR
ncbi:hypothetical protein HFO56_02780 [Rhizobium laguerreae]|uniref:hypothetical protein n=1 Tax=Rhizobium laguerreae TaxID=1076926 RepID=UPI001C90F563|nr:hypothetical protein [Rhizobium laguerreae]MBY3151311.1 hypothetical protein [Rhizobium laguerreae]